MKPHRKVAIAATVVSLCGALLAGCQNEDLGPLKSAMSQQPVNILVNPELLEQRVIAEIYKQVLENDGREVTLVQDPSFIAGERPESIFSGAANMWIGCTGNLLETFDHDEAKVIEKDYMAAQENPDGEDYLARTHIALMAALPTDLTTVDPSSAEGCEDSSVVDLPQFFVPVYAKDLLNRNERNGIASLTKFLDSTEVSELVEKAENSGTPEKVVSEWVEIHIGTKGFGGGADTNDLGSEE